MNNGKSLTFGVREMSCASCVERVEKALRAVAGVKEAHVNLAAETATISVNEAFETDDVTVALDAAGYPAELRTYRFSIQNMSCPSCVGRVERALLVVAGIASVAVNFAKEEATVRVIGASVSPTEIAQTISAAGYPAVLCLKTWLQLMPRQLAPLLQQQKQA